MALVLLFRVEKLFWVIAFPTASRTKKRSHSTTKFSRTGCGDTVGQVACCSGGRSCESGICRT